MKNNKQTEKDLFRYAERKLYDYKYIEDKIDIINFKLNDISITAVDYSKDKLSPTNAFSSAVENEVIRREEKLAALQAEKKQLLYEKALIEKVLKLLTPTELEIVQLRYLGEKNDVISIRDKLCISNDTYNRYKNNAINKIKEYLI